jgi:hypothetical protein
MRPLDDGIRQLRDTMSRTCQSLHCIQTVPLEDMFTNIFDLILSQHLFFSSFTQGPLSFPPFIFSSTTQPFFEVFCRHCYSIYSNDPTSFDTSFGKYSFPREIQSPPSSLPPEEQKQHLMTLFPQLWMISHSYLRWQNFRLTVRLP